MHLVQFFICANFDQVGKTTEDIEILLIVSESGTQKGLFPTTNFEMKMFSFKFVKNATFYPKLEN